MFYNFLNKTGFKKAIRSVKNDNGSLLLLILFLYFFISFTAIIISIALSKNNDLILPIITTFLALGFLFVKVHMLLKNNSKTQRNSEESSIEFFIDNHPLSTALIDSNFKIIKYNVAFKQLFSFDDSKNELRLDQLLKCTNGNDFKNVFLDFIENKGHKKSFIEVEIKNNNNKSSSLYVNKSKNLHEKSDKLIISLIDTTDLKSLQMSFTHSQKMQAIGQLAGGIAHDFNNLLTAMLGFCDLLLAQHKPSDPSFPNIIQIKQNANRAANLVKQLLAFSRKQTLQPKVINITDTIADLSNLIGRLIGEKIDLNIQHGENLGNVIVDKTQLEQVIVNLAVNARDAMKNSGTLTIRTSNQSISSENSLSKDLIPPSLNDEIIAGEYILIEVIDTGCGIAKDDILKIFDPFFSTKAIGAGTGLGLSTVYGIVKQTDGYIYVSSKINEGSNFSVFLNRCFEKVDMEQINDIDIAGEINEQLAKPNMILLVEDEDPVRIFTTNALKSKGYDVLSPQTVDEALEIIDEKGYEIDLVISDVMMPGMNGPDMIKIAHEKYPELKVIFISGYGEDAFIETYGKERHFNFLAKPYSLNNLAKKVKTVLND